MTARKKQSRRIKMAQYEVKHACGHTRTIQLFGKTKDRYSKIEWMETQDCPCCWGEKKRAEEAKQPITMTIRANGLDSDGDGNLLAEIILTGGTINKKDEIKQLGYSWTEERGGVMDFLSTSKPNMAWIKRVPIIELEITHPTAIQIQADAKQLDATIIGKIGPMDLAMIAERSKKLKEETEKKEIIEKKIAEIEKPKRPACHPLVQHPNGRWNKTYYGSEKYGYNYYVDGVNYKLTNSEHAELIAYTAAFNDYRNKIEQIKKEN